jgi:hypothetical protein
MNSFGDELTPFLDEEADKFLEAWERRDAEFFRDIAKKCEVESPDFLLSTVTAFVRSRARQVKKELEQLGKPITRAAIRKEVELEYGGCMARFNPDRTEMGRIIGGKQNYRMVLRHCIEEDKTLKKRVEDNIRRFPSDVWKRIWTDAELKTVKVR